jgi:hypothetical protein
LFLVYIQNRSGPFTKIPTTYSLAQYFLRIGFLSAFVLILFSCKDQTDQNFTSNIVFPDSLVSFNNQVKPLFLQTCAASGCHGGTQPAANLNLEINTWISLIDYSPQIVTPNNGSNSLLVKYIDGRISPQMPLRSQPLKTNQINGVRKWIDEGAKNN